MNEWMDDPPSPMTLLSGLPKPTGHLFPHSCLKVTCQALDTREVNLKKKNMVPAFKGLGKQMQPENDDCERWYVQGTVTHIEGRCRGRTTGKHPHLSALKCERWVKVFLADHQGLGIPGSGNSQGSLTHERVEIEGAKSSSNILGNTLGEWWNTGYK